MVDEPLTIWTIGHSSAELEELFRLLAAQGIDVLADVRSSPYSQYAPQANREILAAACRSAADAALGAYLRCLADGIVSVMQVAS